MAEITAIESVRRALMMADAGYGWKPDPEHVGTLLREYDRLSARPASAGVGLVDRLQHAITTAMNDDLSEVGSEKRQRHVARIEAMQDALDALSARAGSKPEGDALGSHACCRSHPATKRRDDCCSQHK